MENKFDIKISAEMQRLYSTQFFWLLEWRLYSWSILQFPLEIF